MAQGPGISGAGHGPATPEIELPLGEYVGGVQDRVNPLINAYLEGVEDPANREMFAHALGGEAPTRIRPALAYITGDTLEVARDEVDELALAVELIHSASLVMDDLPGQDNSNLRRGQEALHVKFGVGQAEIAVTAMVVKASRLAIGADVRQGLGGRLADYVLEAVGEDGMCLGQSLDLRSADRPPEEIGVEELDKINGLKTGKAIEISTVGAAIIGDVPEEIIALLRQYSYHLGLAYQAEDDIWDGTKTSDEIGKPTGIDERNGKPTYLSVLGEEATREKATTHAEAALATLDGIPTDLNPIKLREIAEYIIKR